MKPLLFLQTGLPLLWLKPPYAREKINPSRLPLSGSLNTPGRNHPATVGNGWEVCPLSGPMRRTNHCAVDKNDEHENNPIADEANGQVTRNQSSLIFRNPIDFTMKTIRKCDQHWWFCLVTYLQMNLMPAVTLGQEMAFRAQVTPPSPEVSALAKFADTRISHYSGLPDINIPLYAIAEQELEIPVRLSYHAGGIRVEERAGWAGLGWALNAGGSISRTMKGLPDEHNQSSSGYIQHDVLPDQLSTSQLADYYNRTQSATIDFEQDIFHFAFANFSGKFVLDKNGEVAFLNASNLKIQFDQVNRNIVRWKVWDGRGNQYVFEDLERTITEAISEGKSALFRSIYHSAWHLSKIITYGGREITFLYENYTESYYSRATQSASYFLSGTSGSGVCGTNRMTNGFSEVTIRGKQLQAIHFGLGKILIESKDDRKDAASRRLSGIKVFNNRDRLIRSFTFDHDYYQSTLSGEHINLPDFIARATPGKRLRLTKVIENTTSQVLEYFLEYNANTLPHLFSNAQDHWGFYNGEDNRSLIPQYMKFRQANANRLVVPEKAAMGCLKKISYPTGGTITYEMESNTVLVRSNDYYNYFSPVALEKDQPIYSASVNSKRPKAYFQVEPQESEVDTHKLIRYSVQLNGSVDCDGRGRDCRGSLDVYLYSPADRSFVSLLSNTIKKGSITGEIWLKAGTQYQLQLEGPASVTAGVTATVSGRKNPPNQEGTGQIEVPTGGLRVKSITKDFGHQTETIQYRYEQAGDSISSGSLATFPKYDFITFNTNTQKVPGRNDILVDHCLKFELRSYSQLPLSSGADFFGYANIKEIRENEEGEILRTDYQYLSPKHFPDQSRYVAPFGIVRSAEGKRGVPAGVIYFVQTKEGFQKSRELTYTYQASERASHENFVFSCMGYGPGGCQDVRYLKYFNTTVWNPRIEIKEIRFDIQTGTAFDKTSTTTYDENYLLPIKQTHSLSRHANLEEYYYYPFNLPEALNASGDQSILAGLMDANRITPSLAQVKKMAGQQVEQQQVQMKRYHGKILPAGLHKKHADHQTFMDLSILSYDSFGNILEQTPRTGPRQSFLWFEEGRWMAAAVHNAAASEIAYTSFETADKGGWTFTGDPYSSKGAKTGVNLYHLGRGAINKTEIPASPDRVFLLSFWAKRTSRRTSANWSFMGETVQLTDEWQLIQREVTGDKLTLSGQGVLIDELRLHPKDAFMETYTHEPLIGISSNTDQRNHTRYYEYDAMGRLETIRNMDWDILEHYAYTYQSQKPILP
ncbi:hypothetical protein [Cyclobacterium plantarum]|uniref:YD repeat-containing protein n=1 Tax=Cyclobacterium plantarum TaxID=2716263 RepID=A0ABX0H7Q7_9BACT|nr:hypothetical protein [Cyclobacterium plantarum]NHE57914.1 hypothetical protein [Cyclobacterium plantarum]